MMLLYSVTSMMQESERKGTQITVVEHQACEQAETKKYAFVRLGAQAKVYVYLRKASPRPCVMEVAAVKEVKQAAEAVAECEVLRWISPLGGRWEHRMMLVSVLLHVM
jgi:hypothetical protein